MLKISKYIVIVSWLLTSCFGAMGQTKKLETKEKSKKDTLSWRGITVEADLASIAANNIGLLKSETQWYEGAMSANLSNKYFPVVEMGYATTFKDIPNAGIYTCKGLYQKVGLDINIKKKSKEKSTNNIISFGLRIGHSSFDYQYSNVYSTDSYWGGTSTYNYPTQTTSQYWYELVGGIRVELFTNLYMGWSVRNKIRLTHDAVNGINPWSIPGYGPTGTDNNWQINYTVGYYFNWYKTKNKSIINLIKTNK